MKLSPIKRKRNLNKIFAALFILLVIVLLVLFQKGIKSFFYTISLPIQRVLIQSGNNFSDFFIFLKEGSNLKKERDDINFKNQELLVEISSLKELKNENETLRKALDIDLSKEFKLIFAQVTGKDISQDYILIDKGSDDGVGENMTVITEQKVLAGKVSEVFKKFSKVIIISNKKSSFDAKIQKTDTQIQGLVRGEGGEKVIFDLVSKEKEVSKDDLLITSNLGGIFPPGILVGKVEKVEKRDTDAFQYIEIKTAADFKELNSVFLIK